jgi:MFS family permease
MTHDGEPTRVRYGVLGFLCGLTFILYLDRTCIGKTMPAMQRELGLTDVQVAYVQSAFTVAYGLFEIVTGHWGDRYGTRRVLTRIVLWWSFFTALTGVANGFGQLLVVRFLFGAGEAGALPNTARVTQTWFPAASRGRVRGLVNMPALLGGVVAPPATAYLMEAFGWRTVFHTYGWLGVVWAIAFWCWYRDTPDEHPGVNEAERRVIGPLDAPSHQESVPWRDIVGNTNVWLMGCVLVSGAMAVYTLFAWYPSYLENRIGLSNIESGWQSGLVMAGGALGCLSGGWLLDWIVHTRLGKHLGRNVVGSGGYGLASLGMLCGALWHGSPLVTSLCFAIACFGIHLPAGAWWSVAADVGGRHIGAFFASINCIGVFGAALAQTGFGYVPREHWHQAFAFCALPLAIGSFCWSRINTRSP